MHCMYTCYISTNNYLHSVAFMHFNVINGKKTTKKHKVLHLLYGKKPNLLDEWIKY